MTQPEQAKVPVGGNAPYKTAKRGSKWCVLNNAGDVKATFDGDDAGYQKALAYLRALYANVPGAAKRADDHKFTGTARRRGPAPEKSREGDPSATANDKDPKGGLSAAGRKKFGVKKGVTSYATASEEDKKRWVRWALRFTKTARPLKDDKGQPTRYALMFRAWGEPVPTSTSAVSAVHSKALTRRKQLGMGDSEKASLYDAEFVDWEVEIEESLRERLLAAYGTVDGAVRHTFVPTGHGACMVCGRPQVSPAHDADEPYLQENTDVAGSPAPQEAAYTGKGCMVALYPSESALGGLDVKGDLPLEERQDMHVTVVYLPTTPEDLDRLSEAVASVAADSPPLRGVWGGTARFNPSEGSDNKPVLVALPDVPGLSTLHERMADALDVAGFPVARNHGYTPHLTVAYDDNGRVRAEGELAFDAVTLVAGGSRTSFALGGDAEKAAAHKKHRYVGAHHLRDHVVKTAGYVDAALTLLRSTPDLPPYAAQAQALLQGIEPACDALLDYFGVPDADDDEADAQDEATQEKLREQSAALSEVEEREMKLENTHIAGAKVKPEAAVPHEFRAAKYPGPSGVPRCIMCGQTPTPSGICNDPLHPPVAAVSAPKVSPAGPKDIRALAQVVDRVKADDLPPADLPAVKAFLTEAHGRTVLTAPASTFQPVWEKALTPNEHMLWMQGAFVGAEQANRNGAFWSTADLQLGEPTVKHGPLNWLHEARHVVGTIADAKLVTPTTERAAAGENPHISAVAAVWRWVYPDEAFVIEQASDQGKLWYSMECISKEVACMGDNGCGQSFPYMDMISSPFSVCKHVREKSSTRRFVDPTFLGGAVIVPPVRPGWGEANASVMREAASLSEKAFHDAGSPDVAASEWELLMASVVAYASRA